MSNEFHSIRALLPALTFDPAQDGAALAPLVNSYLKFYQLPEHAAQYAIGRLANRAEDIVAQYWLPDLPRGTVILVHGYFDHVGLYRHAIEHFLSQRYAVVAFDLPGHGLSAGKRAAIDSFDDYAAVLSTCVQQCTWLPQPLHVVGQSTGAATIMKYLFRYGDDLLSGIVLLSPLVRPPGWQLQRWKFLVFRHFVQTVPRADTISSNDPVYARFSRHEDPLHINFMTAEWIGAMKHWIDTLPALPVLDCQPLLIQGEQDLTVDWRFNVPEVSKHFSRIKTLFIPGAYHNLVNESTPIRTQVWQTIDSYLSEWKKG